MNDADFDAAGVAYREAKAAVPAHLRIQHAAEVAVVDWLRAHRHVPADKLYAPTGEPLDKELVTLEQAVKKTEADVQWCRALVIACGEAVKGQSFTDIVASQVQRPTVDSVKGVN